VGIIVVCAYGLAGRLMMAIDACVCHTCVCPCRMWLDERELLGNAFIFLLAGPDRPHVRTYP
jgi:hypothetical protein